MFDKVKFAEIIKKISGLYNSQRDFSILSGINRTYLSLYMNMKLNEPPKPKILERLANSSHGITTYIELMDVCGYTDTKSLEQESLKELYNKLEENFLDMLYSIKLSKKENEIFEDLCKTINVYSFDNLTESEIHNKLSYYFDNINHISKPSKEKIEKKLIIFIQYCLQTHGLRNKILSKQNNNNHISISSQFYMCPVYGQISAGQPNWAEECIEGRIPIDPNLMNIVNPEEHFFLRVNGESMNKIVKNGAYALIHKQDIVDDGEIAVVLVNGYNATLKKFSKQGNFVILEPMSTVTDDPEIKTQIYDKNTSIKILGKYVGKFEINK